MTNVLGRSDSALLTVVESDALLLDVVEVVKVAAFVSLTVVVVDAKLLAAKKLRRQMRSAKPMEVALDVPWMAVTDHHRVMVCVVPMAVASDVSIQAARRVRSGEIFVQCMEAIVHVVYLVAVGMTEVVASVLLTVVASDAS